MTSAPTNRLPRKSAFRRFAPLLGFFAGAFLVPVALFLFCVGVLHDMGGIFLYPLAGMVAAPFGLLVGVAIRGDDPVSREDGA